MLPASRRPARPGRPAAPGLSRAARQSIRRTVAFLGNEADHLQRQADDLIAATAALQADCQLLESIPGVGAVTAQAILAELTDPARFACAQQAAAYAGLAPAPASASAPGWRRRGTRDCGRPCACRP